MTIKLLTKALGLCMLLASCTPSYDVLIVGGGASGTMAGIQSARMGSKTLIAEETVWVGGMLTSAGVSAIDGNYKLRGGLFGEFTDALAEHYGGYEALKTAWVSNIMFEPSVGERILEQKIAKEKNLTLCKEYVYKGARKLSKGWVVTFDTPKGEKNIKCQVLVDGTELGDVAKDCGIKYHIGFDPKSYTGEKMAFEQGNDIVQDLTLVMTLKDYGPDADMTIEKPENYDRMNYVNCCKNPHNTPVFEKGQPLWPAEEMLSYGKLQNGKFMINWPVESNDFYANIIEMDRAQRDSVINLAKLRTLGFLYFLQTELGYKNLGLADDEYPTADKLAFFPYHRESRRTEGEYLFTMDEAERRYDFKGYRTGVAVGDYPVDHHHYAHPQWKDLVHLWFAQIPSFSLPVGTLVPLGVEDFVVAEKSISVSNLVNGTTRLQPVVCEIGQCAGVIASLAVSQGKAVRDVKVRDIQKVLLEAGAYLQPYLDLPVSDANFAALQRIGCTGILQAEGRNVGWANESWMRVSDPLLWNELHLEEYYGIPYNNSSAPVTKAEFVQLLHLIKANSAASSAGCSGCSKKSECGSSDSCSDKLACGGCDNEGSCEEVSACGGCKNEGISRLEAIVLLDAVLNPFERDVNFDGELL